MRSTARAQARHRNNPSGRSQDLRAGGASWLRPARERSCWSSSAARDDALIEREAIFGDLAGAREPDPLGELVLDAVPDGLAQRAQPERLADDEAVQRERKHERLAFGGFRH